MTSSDLPQLEQLFCVPLSWKEFKGEEEARCFLREAVESGVGGIILYGGDMEATPRLLAEVQDGLETPLLVMADLETGMAQQFPGGTEFPGMMALGATRSPELAREIGLATALDARQAGINVVLAPVLDVNINPLNPIINVRSFGDDPALVSDLGAAYMVGCHEGGVIAVAKHFPGHGDTDVDSHISLPVVRRGPVSVETVELPPFARAIGEGLMAIMVGHIAVPSLTGSETRPASLSHDVVTDLLRDRLGYDGLVISDAMIMGAAGEASEEAQTAVRALKAGVDMLLYVKDVDRAVRAVGSAIADGSLDRVAVCKAVERITSARNHLLPLSAGVEDACRVSGQRERGVLAEDVAGRSATLVRNRGDLFPLSSADDCLFIILGDSVQSGALPLSNLLRKEFPAGHIVRLEANGADLPDSVIGEVRAAATVVLFIFSTVRAWRGVAGLSPGGRRAADTLLRQAKRAAVVSLGSPYIMRSFAWIDACLCLYSPSTASLASAVRVISGRLNPSGRLPVNIPGLYPRGWGLSYGS